VVRNDGKDTGVSKNIERVNAVRSVIKGVVFQNTTRKVIEQATDLESHLFTRIDGHILSRLKYHKYLDFWCFRWARVQFSRVALISSMAGHVKKDLQVMNEMDCLLTCIWSTFNVVEKESKLEGSYLVFDAVHGRIRRSGKASPVSISTRWSEKNYRQQRLVMRDGMVNSHTKIIQTSEQNKEKDSSISSRFLWLLLTWVCLNGMM